jgi:C_GCAxxG_C_C family probable redox protein
LNKYRERAMELFKQGYNCSQAVFAAFSEEMGIDFETALKISSSFGGGMGRLREVCGAVSGMFMVAGTKYGYTDPKDRHTKSEHYKLIQSMADRFKNTNKSLICRELLGQIEQNISHMPDARTDKYYKKRPCAELVGDAAEIMYEIMENRNSMKKENYGD